MKNEQETPPPVLNKFNIDYESENGFNYNLTLYLQNSLIHFSLFSTNLPSTFYQKEFSFDDLKNIKYYSAFFENINDIYCDICDLIKEKHLVMMEKEKSILLIINLPMKKLGQLTFEITEKEKDQNQINKELMKVINELQKKVKNLEEKTSLLNLMVTDKDKEIFKKLLGEKELKFELIYKRRIHGIVLNNFHALVDNSGPSVTFILTTKGKKFGACTSLGYDSKSEWKKDEKAFIFSIDLNKKYPFKNTDGYSLYCNASYGIYFGNISFNIKNLTNGSLNSAYSYDINYEFNDNSTNFECSDIEIYKIIK